MSFVLSSASDVSKNQIVRVNATYSPQKHYKYPNHTWVWLEDWAKHWNTDKAVASARGEYASMTPKFGRTKYKVYQNQPNNEQSLTSDNSYVEQNFEAFNGHTVAYCWDKKPIKEKVEKAIAKHMKNHAKEILTPRCELNEYHQTGLLIAEFLTRDFPEKSLLVKLSDYPTHYERYDYVAYAPVPGYYMSAPELTITHNHGSGYDLLIYFNNKKTEKCPQFAEIERLMKGGVFNMNGHIITKWEGATQSFFLSNLINQHLGEDRTPTTEMLLCDCEWTITKDKGEDAKERTFIRRTKTFEEPYRTYTRPNGRASGGVLKDIYPVRLGDLKRLEFAKELSEKVFHPDRVARFMGDTWGTDDSWLAQVM
jgi:hypothetical protein